MTRRLGIAFSENAYNRMKHLTETLNISQAKLIECLMQLSEEEIQTQIVKVFPKITQGRKEMRIRARELASKMASLSPEKIAQIDALLKGANDVE